MRDSASYGKPLTLCTGIIEHQRSRKPCVTLVGFPYPVTAVHLRPTPPAGVKTPPLKHAQHQTRRFSQVVTALPCYTYRLADQAIPSGA